MITGAHCRGTSPWVRSRLRLFCLAVAACTLGELPLPFGSSAVERGQPVGRAIPGRLATQPFFLR
jgi:hypothetical protein